MLLFNHKKEFLGIDSKYLELFGYNSLSDLLIEVDDFADLFVKKPGFIHNFKHVNWIDFIECADTQESAKVIINANARNFQCFMSVNIIYLTQDPSSKAYQINLNSIKELTDNETKYISVDSLEQSTPVSPPSKTLFESNTQAETTFETPIINNIEKNPFTTDSYNSDAPLDIDFNDNFQEQEKPILKEPTTAPQIETTSPLIVEEKFSTVNEMFDNGYTFDPLIASSELGLPVDLIEEFIEDFISQAKEFKDELYESQSNADNENIKVLSHKLKGVAANLRIEDALESLTIINTTNNNDDIKEELDIFYKIVAKLSGETIEVVVPIENTPEEPQELEELELDFKEEEKVDIFSHDPLQKPIEDLELDLKEDIKEEKIDIFSPSTETVNEPKEDSLSLELEDLELDLKEEKIDIFSPSTEAVNTPKEDTLSLELEDLELDLKEEKIDIFSPSTETVNEPKEDSLSLELEDLELDLKEEKIDIFSPSTETVNEPKEDSLSLELEDLELDFKENEIPELTVEETEPPVIITYNKKRVASEIGLDVESFNELFEDYTLEALDLSKSIDKAIQTNNRATWQQLAIRLKGMSDNMRVKDFIKELETLISAQTVDVAQEANTYVSQCITQLLKIKE